jgi:hypothetical protein
MEPMCDQKLGDACLVYDRKEQGLLDRVACSRALAVSSRELQIIFRLSEEEHACGAAFCVSKDGPQQNRAYCRADQQS